MGWVLDTIGGLSVLDGARGIGGAGGGDWFFGFRDRFCYRWSTQRKVSKAFMTFKLGTSYLAPVSLIG